MAKVGRPTKYKPDFHPEDCVRLGRLGKFKVQMALEWEVDTDTIDEWRKVHPEFSGAYNKASNYRTAWLMDQAQFGLSKGMKFNALAWSMMMRYDGQNTEERKVKLPELRECKTFAEKAKCVVNAFGDGKLTPKEANTLADLICKEAKVEETTELRAKLEAIEEHLDIY